MILWRSLFDIVVALLLLAPASASAAYENEGSPFKFGQSALAPAPARGWVVLLPGENEFGFAPLKMHYEKIANCSMRTASTR